MSYNKSTRPEQLELFEPIAVSPEQATRLVPIGKTKLYEALNSGAIESRLVNGRRWIIYASLKQFAGVS